MRVHKYLEAILTTFVKDLDHIVDINLVVLFGSSMLDGLPGKDKTEHVPTPRSESCQVDLGSHIKALYRQ